MKLMSSWNYLDTGNVAQNAITSGRAPRIIMVQGFATPRNYANLVVGLAATRGPLKDSGNLCVNANNAVLHYLETFSYLSDNYV